MKIAATFLAAATTVGAFAPTAFNGRLSTAAHIAVGDKLPSVELFQGFPDPEKINIADYAEGKNMIIVPGYIEARVDLKAAGVDEVVVYCVNDPAVMQAWSENQGVRGMVSMMSDAASEFTKAIDLEMTHPGPPSVGIIGRSKRFAMLVVDGEVKHLAVSEGPDDPAGDNDPSASLADAMLKVVEETKIENPMVTK